MSTNFIAIIFIVIFTVSSAMANTEYEIKNPAEIIECYELAHGENGMGSTNSIIIPPFVLEGASLFQFSVVNIGEKSVNVHLTLFDQDGNRYEPLTGQTFLANFSSTNSPIRKLDGTGAAILKSLESGWMRLDNSDPGFYHAVLTWQADSCLTEPTLVAYFDFQAIFNGGSDRDFTRVITINGGNPF